MILVNLLPDLRQAKLKERRRRQLVSGVAVLVWIVCGSVVALMALYAVGQKAYIDNITKKIKGNEDNLRSMPDLVPAMTAQQHLSSLASLYNGRVYLSKFFEAFMEADPVDVVINSMAIDSNVLTISGTAPSYSEASKVSRALEASNVKVGAGAATSNSPYFTSVALTSASSSKRGEVEFSVTANIAAEVTSGSK